MKIELNLNDISVNIELILSKILCENWIMLMKFELILSKIEWNSELILS